MAVEVLARQHPRDVYFHVKFDKNHYIRSGDKLTMSHEIENTDDEEFDGLIGPLKTTQGQANKNKKRNKQEKPDEKESIGSMCASLDGSNENKEGMYKCFEFEIKGKMIFQTQKLSVNEAYAKQKLWSGINGQFFDEIEVKLLRVFESKKDLTKR